MQIVFHVNVTTRLAASLNGLVQDGIKSAGSITSPVISATPNRVLMLKIVLKSVANNAAMATQSCVVFASVTVARRSLKLTRSRRVVREPLGTQNSSSRAA